jgi:hypothetical protein
LKELHCDDGRSTNLIRLDAEDMEQLLHLPALTCLEDAYFSDAALSFLPRFPLLHEVRFVGESILERQNFDSADALFAALAQCRTVERVDLWNIELTRARGEAMLVGMPKLNSMTLWDCHMPDGLSFLRCASSTLVTVDFEWCQTLTPGQLPRGLQYVPQLHELIINECFVEDMTEAQERMLTEEAMKNLLPNLESYQYWPYFD